VRATNPLTVKPTALARERVHELPEDWPGAWDLIKSLLKGSIRRFLEDGGSQ
jgi:hypothetical protein